MCFVHALGLNWCFSLAKVTNFTEFLFIIQAFVVLSCPPIPVVGGGGGGGGGSCGAWMPFFVRDIHSSLVDLIAGIVHEGYTPAARLWHALGMISTANKTGNSLLLYSLLFHTPPSTLCNTSLGVGAKGWGDGECC